MKLMISCIIYPCILTMSISINVLYPCLYFKVIEMTTMFGFDWNLVAPIWLINFPP